jgi:hypothetical protein
MIISFFVHKIAIPKNKVQSLRILYARYNLTGIRYAASHETMSIINC